ncbi:peroxisomal membrane anchor protein conserved region-domain-containing protein [Armillaria luteobubalina]|uniref:Peroxisomal membrane protein PEX14 n=1 Tax=Armillaria luteobubalina TaxID=153913 RepID=A0AA39UWH9_9AGAR|nr:peroxisomal membrane anchor protein conserved region-domain-containing protein [Armillaria luteobubalina]
MSTPDRQELLRNAVAFLSDPKSQASPLAQRIQFLESKGLNSQEIDIALRQSSNTSAPVSYPAPYSASPFPTVPSTQWDWRDYFITAVVSGTITYGAVTLFKKYLLPHLQPPSTTAYEQDRDALNAQFDAAEALLKEIQAETALVRAAVEEQKEKVDKTTKDIEQVVTEMRGSELKTRDEMREIRDEVNTIREMLPKMIDRNKEAQAQSLAELQQELKSLKALLLSRGSMNISSSPSTPIPTPGRPSIPAWQLASAPSPVGSTELPTPSYTLPTAVSNGKGKEVDMSPSIS